jgi:hypothetical protein
MEEVGAKAGVEFLHVPFKGYADGAIALMGGTSWCRSTRPAGPT